jgi:hypothetical protein
LCAQGNLVFEILGNKGGLAPQHLLLRDRYLEGLVAYREKRWDDALRALNASLEADLAGDPLPIGDVAHPFRTRLEPV